MATAADMATATLVPADQGPDDAPPACGLLKLGNDELALVAALCGREAPILAHLCRALSHVWHMVCTEPRMLAQLLVHVCGEADGWWRPTYTQTPLDIMRVRGAGMVAADADAVRLLLDAGVDVHAWDEEVLRLAAKRGSADTIALALQRGADVHAHGDEALREAALHGHADVLRALLDAGADAHADACAALRGAVGKGRVDTAQLLLVRGSPPEKHMLFVATERGDDAMVRLLLAAGADLHADGDRALCIAANRGRLSTASLLLDAGADVHANDELALECALRGQSLDVAELLLQAGAQLRQPFSNTMVGVCISAGRLDSLRLLAKYGVEYDWPEALRFAAGCGYEGMLQFVLEQRGGGAANRDAKAVTEALWAAVHNGRDRAVALLLPLCASNAFAVAQALRAASRHGRPQVMQQLLQHPAVADDQACKDDALVCAAASGCVQAIKALLRAGADVHPARFGEAALFAAAGSASLPAVKLLVEAGANAAALSTDAAEHMPPLGVWPSWQYRPKGQYRQLAELLKSLGAPKQPVAALADRWWQYQELEW